MNISNEYVAKEKGDVVPSFLQRVRKEQIIFKKSNLVSPPIKSQESGRAYSPRAPNSAAKAIFASAEGSL